MTIDDMELEILNLRGALAPFAECHDMLEDGSEIELRPAHMGGVVTLPRSVFSKAAEVLFRAGSMHAKGYGHLIPKGYR